MLPLPSVGIAFEWTHSLAPTSLSFTPKWRLSSKEISMSRSFAAATRRATRLMRPHTYTKAVRKVQKAMVGAIVKSALTPLTSTKAKRRRTALPKAGQSLGPS